MATARNDHRRFAIDVFASESRGWHFHALSFALITVWSYCTVPLQCLVRVSRLLSVPRTALWRSAQL